VRRNVENVAKDAALEFTMWIQQTHSKIFHDLFQAYQAHKGRKEEEE
tara:strand:- start:4568 stop:4708 length:141 start_codon:yes stop_codon:yes gene_type:complete